MEEKPSKLQFLMDGLEFKALSPAKECQIEFFSAHSDLVVPEVLIAADIDC